MTKINKKNKWHHCSSPLIWKETLINGSKAYYIGGDTEFLEYCHSYYKFDSYVNITKLAALSKNIVQFKKKLKDINNIKTKNNIIYNVSKEEEKCFAICITGVMNPLVMYLISGLLEISMTAKRILKIYLYDHNYDESTLSCTELECKYITRESSKNVVKYVSKLGIALTKSDLLIIFDHQSFELVISI